MRAYEVKKFTGKSLFHLIKETKPNFNQKVFKKLFINIPRDLLNKKIEKRVEKMFKEGVIRGSKRFFKMKVYKELSANKIIGINEIKAYLQGKLTLIKAKELIKLKKQDSMLKDNLLGLEDI